MLSRRHLRIKVLQALYAFIQSGNDRLDVGERQLIKSIDALYEQYVYFLSFLIAIFNFAEKRMEEAKKKYLPTAEDLDPNTRFIDNKFIKQLAENSDFLRKEEKLKINWVDEEEMIRKIFVKIRDGKEYQVFMDLETCAYKDDQEICLQIFKKYITGFSILEDYFEEKNIHWASDYYLAVWLAMKTIKNFKQEDGRSTHLPPVLKTSDDDDNEDLDFIKRLFRKTILKQEESEKLIEERARNWEIDRIAMMDKLIISMAVTELIEFPSIPVKVTLNEYIELAKIFSTSKSRVFINGILDKLISDLKKEKKIIKTGRGLID